MVVSISILSRLEICWELGFKLPTHQTFVPLGRSSWSDELELFYYYYYHRHDVLLVFVDLMLRREEKRRKLKKYG